MNKNIVEKCYFHNRITKLLFFMKKVLFLICVSLFSMKSMAQDYYHGLGAQYNIGIFNYSYTTPEVEYGFSGSLGVPGIVYKASLAFEIDRKSNFAISSYPFVGFMISNSVGSYLGAEINALGEYVIGDLDDQCFYMGAGFALSYLNTGGDGGSVVGPQVGVGGQLEIRDQIYGVRAAFTYGINKGKYIPSDATNVKDSKMMIGIGVYYPFGQ